jgi:hypothetical protein
VGFLALLADAVSAGRKYSAKNYVVQALAGMQRLSSGAGRRVYVTICFN